MEKLIAGHHVTEEDLMLLCQLPDPTHGHGQFCNEILVCVKNNPLVTLLALQSQEQEASLEQLFERTKVEKNAEVCGQFCNEILVCEE